MPRMLFPSRSKGGDQHIIPITLGTTSRTAPEMPDLAGKPTWTRGANKMWATTRSNKTGNTFKQIPEFPLTHVEGKLSREVVHAAGVHETQGVANGFSAQHTLACDWTNTSIGQCGSHDASWLTGHLNGAQLEPENWNDACEKDYVFEFTALLKGTKAGMVHTVCLGTVRWCHQLTAGVHPLSVPGIEPATFSVTSLPLGPSSLPPL